MQKTCTKSLGLLEGAKISGDDGKPKPIANLGDKLIMQFQRVKQEFDGPVDFSALIAEKENNEGLKNF
jgi:hypothetical protein